MEETSPQLAPSCSEGGAGGVSQDGQLGQLAVAAVLNKLLREPGGQKGEGSVRWKVCCNQGLYNYSRKLETSSHNSQPPNKCIQLDPTDVVRDEQDGGKPTVAKARASNI